MSYPVYEETKTLEFRWYSDTYGSDIRLQQKVVIRDGVGTDAKITEDWRDIQIVRIQE